LVDAVMLPGTNDLALSVARLNALRSMWQDPRRRQEQLFPAGKVLTAEQLSPSDKQKPVLLEYVRRYEGKFGPGTRNTFGGHALDAMLILKPAIERTLTRGFLPDNVAGFRKTLRDEIESGTKELVGITGVFTLSAQDHMGLDERAAVMIRVQGGTWTRVPTLR